MSPPEVVVEPSAKPEGASASSTPGLPGQARSPWSAEFEVVRRWLIPIVAVFLIGGSAGLLLGQKADRQELRDLTQKTEDLNKAIAELQKQLTVHIALEPASKRSKK
jgi:hypothetical protein